MVFYKRGFFDKLDTQIIQRVMDRFPQFTYYDVDFEPEGDITETGIVWFSPSEEDMDNGFRFLISYRGMQYTEITLEDDQFEEYEDVKIFLIKLLDLLGFKERDNND